MKFKISKKKETRNIDFLTKKKHLVMEEDNNTTPPPRYQSASNSDTEDWEKDIIIPDEERNFLSDSTAQSQDLSFDSTETFSDVFDPPKQANSGPQPSVVEGEDGATSRAREVGMSTQQSRSPFYVEPYGVGKKEVPGDSTEPWICTTELKHLVTPEERENVWIIDEDQFDLVLLVIKANILPEDCHKYIQYLWRNFREIVASDCNIRDKYEMLMSAGMNKRKPSKKMEELGKRFLEKIQKVNKIKPDESGYRNKVAVMEELRDFPDLAFLDHIDLLDAIDWNNGTVYAQMGKLHTMANDKNNIKWALSAFYEPDSYERYSIVPEIVKEKRYPRKCIERKREYDGDMTDSYQSRQGNQEKEDREANVQQNVTRVTRQESTRENKKQNKTNKLQLKRETLQRITRHIKAIGIKPNPKQKQMREHSETRGNASYIRGKVEDENPEEVEYRNSGDTTTNSLKQMPQVSRQRIKEQRRRFITNKDLIEKHSKAKWLQPRSSGVCLYNTEKGRCKFIYRKTPEYKEHFEEEHQDLILYQANHFLDERIPDYPIPCFPLDGDYLTNIRMHQERFNRDPIEYQLCGLYLSGIKCSTKIHHDDQRVAHILVCHPDQMSDLSEKEMEYIEYLTGVNRALLKSERESQKIRKRETTKEIWSKPTATSKYPDNPRGRPALKPHQDKEVPGRRRSQVRTECTPMSDGMTAKRTTSSCSPTRVSTSYPISVRRASTDRHRGNTRYALTTRTNTPSATTTRRAGSMDSKTPKLLRPKLKLDINNAMNQRFSQPMGEVCGIPNQSIGPRNIREKAQRGSTDISRNQLVYPTRNPLSEGQVGHYNRLPYLFRCPWIRPQPCQAAYATVEQLDHHLIEAHHMDAAMVRSGGMNPPTGVRYFREIRGDCVQSFKEDSEESGTDNEGEGADEDDFDILPTNSSSKGNSNITGHGNQSAGQGFFTSILGKSDASEQPVLETPRAPLGNEVERCPYQTTELRCPFTVDRNIMGRGLMTLHLRKNHEGWYGGKVVAHGETHAATANKIAKMIGLPPTNCPTLRSWLVRGAGGNTLADYKDISTPIAPLQLDSKNLSIEDVL